MTKANIAQMISQDELLKASITGNREIFRRAANWAN